MRRWVLVLGAALVLAGLIGWRLRQNQAKAATEKRQGAAMRNAPSLVETAVVKRQDITKTFEVVGNVEAPLAVDVSPKVTGRILQLTVREGDRVSAGQLLVRIDPTEVEAEVRQKQAALAGARSRLAEAAVTRSSQGVGVASAILQQRAALQTARAQNRQARADQAAQIAAAQAGVAEAAGRVSAAKADIAAADAAVTSAEANLARARVEQRRQEALVKEGAAAQQVLDDARTAFQVQEAALGEARQRRSAAQGALASAEAQQRAVERQVQIVGNKAQADIAASAAGVSQAQATLATARANTSQTSAFAQNLAALRSAVTAAQADVRASEARLADTTLRAPISGIVTQRPLDPGALASPNQPILSIQAVQQVWAAVSIPEEITRRIYQGQTASVTFDAMPGKAFAGRIAQILPAADAQSRQFTARVRLDNQNNRIKPGMFGRVTFVTERAKAALVAPLEAVKTDPEKPGRASVTTVVDGKAQTRPVQTGLSNGKVIAIKTGVAEGDQVIILSTRPVKDGQPVKTGGGRDRRPQGQGGEGAAGNAGAAVPAGNAGASSPARGGSAGTPAGEGSGR